jgi:hypothetical protein
MATQSTKNEACFIGLQVVPTIVWGGTGVGKTTVLSQLAGALGRNFHLLIGSTHLPEDFSGYPDADREAGVIRMLPTHWVDRFRDGAGFLLLDEFTCVPPTTMAAELSLITERRVGDYTLPESTIIVAAANPPELAPSGNALPPSMRSRFFHCHWEVDKNELFKGYRAGLSWSAPPFPVVPAEHRALYPKYGGLVEAFLRGNPDCMEKLPDSDETLAFPNPRTWSYVVKCLAAAESVGHQLGSPVFTTLVNGCVGDAVGAEFVRYLSQLDLVNPADVLAGTVKFKYQSDRPDLSICILTGLVKELRVETTTERWTRAAQVFCEVGEHDVEVFLTQFKSLWNPVNKGGVRPDGWMPPAALLNRLMKLVPAGISDTQ